MRWVTRFFLHVDRTASAWLIKQHIDPVAEFAFVPANTPLASIEGHTFDIRDGEYTHRGTQCTFQVLLGAYGLTSDPALVELGRIVKEADVPSRGRRRPESAGLDAIMRGFQVSVADDYEKLKLTAPVYDALYAYCQELAPGKPRNQATPGPRLNYRRRFIEHLDEG